MGFGNTGKVWTAATLREYLKSIPKPTWIKGITLHHTAAPNLAMRPKGFTAQHIENIKYGYIHERGFHSGPHLFIDEDQAWGMCPFNEFGVHANSFNQSRLGIEVLGDYDSEDPLSGRGLECWQMCASVVAVLLEWLNLPADTKTINFHNDDPLTNKTCPGKKIDKNWAISLVQSRMNGGNANPRNDQNELWYVKYDHQKFGPWSLSGGRVLVPTRSTIKLLGFDDSTLVVKDGIFTYNGQLLEDSFQQFGQGFTPIRELAEALGLTVVSTDNKIVTLEKK